MSRAKKIVSVILLLFIAIQFIQPAHNKSGQAQPADFAKVYTVPDNVQTILKNACYDCHSNNTHYPWYSNIQPVAWAMANHIKKGKQYLNFSEFGTLTNRRQVSKLKEIVNQIKDNEMPIASYKLMHKNAKLSKEEKSLIIKWMNNKADSLSAN